MPHGEQQQDQSQHQEQGLQHVSSELLAITEAERWSPAVRPDAGEVTAVSYGSQRQVLVWDSTVRRWTGAYLTTADMYTLTIAAVLRDGTLALTANWDWGAFTIGGYGAGRAIKTVDIRIGDDDFKLLLTAGTPIIYFDTANNEYISYTRGTNTWAWAIANAAIATLNATALTLIGQYVSIKEITAPGSAGANTKNIYMDTADELLKSKGSDGVIRFLESPTTTRGDIIARNATVDARIAIGTSGKVLHSDGTDPSWQALVAADLPSVTYNILAASGAIVPDTTAGCGTLVHYETTTNKVNYQGLPFDKTTQEHATFFLSLPARYSGGTLTMQVTWAPGASIAATETVDWGFQALILANFATIDTAFPGATIITDTATSSPTGKLHISDMSIAHTPGGTAAGGNLLICRIHRKVSTDNGNDDAILISVRGAFVGTMTDA